MKIALIQMNSKKGDVKRNFAVMTGFIKRAARENADIIVFPEMSLTGYFASAKYLSLALAVDDSIVKRIIALSKTYSLTIIFGLSEKTSLMSRSLFSRLSRAFFWVLKPTAIIILSKSCRDLFTIDWCPMVNGSKDPGNKAIFSISSKSLPHNHQKQLQVLSPDKVFRHQNRDLYRWLNQRQRSFRWANLFRQKLTPP